MNRSTLRVCSRPNRRCRPCSRSPIIRIRRLRQHRQHRLRQPQRLRRVCVHFRRRSLAHHRRRRPQQRRRRLRRQRRRLICRCRIGAVVTSTRCFGPSSCASMKGNRTTNIRQRLLLLLLMYCCWSPPAFVLCSPLSSDAGTFFSRTQVRDALCVVSIRIGTDVLTTKSFV
jgi:hypothetical protein